MSNVFVRRRHKLLSLKALRDSGAVLPGNTEENCPHCGQPVLRRELVKNQYVCPLCGYHHPIGAYYRLSLVLDEGRLVGIGTHAQLLESCPEYREIARSQLSQKELGLQKEDD